MLSRILKTDFRINNFRTQQKKGLLKKRYSTVCGRELKWREVDQLGIWSSNAILNSKFLKSVSTVNIIQNKGNYFRLLNSRVHTKSNDSIEDFEVSLPVIFSIEFIHGLVVLVTLLFVFNFLVPDEPDEGYLADHPVTTEFTPTDYDINMLNGKLKQFYKSPERGIALTADDLNTLFVSLPTTKNIRQYINFLPVTVESEHSSSLPIKISLQMTPGKYFNCIVYYKLVREGSRWGTQLERVKPMYTSEDLSAETIQFFHRDFFNPNFFKVDEVLKPLLDSVHAVHINRFGLLLNSIPLPLVKPTPEEMKEYEADEHYDFLYQTPLFWVDAFPLKNTKVRPSQGYSLLFDSQKIDLNQL